MKIRLTQLTNSLNIPHMKYSRLLTAIMMLTGVLTACSDQENEQDGANERTALSINAGIGVIPAGTSSATTRATDASWQANDAIGIVMLDAGTNTVTEGKTNYRYITITGTAVLPRTERSIPPIIPPQAPRWTYWLITPTP